MPCSCDDHVPDSPRWQSPTAAGISAAHTPACACTFLGGSPAHALDSSALCSAALLHVSVLSFAAPRQYTLRRYTSPVAGTVTVRLPFAGRRAGATLHTPGAELQLVTPSPRAKPGLAVAGATPSSANQSIATSRRRLHSHIDSSSQDRTSAGLALQRILQRYEVLLQ